MCATKRVLIVAALLALCGLTASTRADDKVVEKIKELKKAKVEAAKTCYEARWEGFKVGRGYYFLVYDWSRLWMEAERDLNTKKEDQLAALEAHLKRMKELEEAVNVRFQQGRDDIANATATTFYRLEAELWLAEEKAKK